MIRRRRIVSRTKQINNKQLNNKQLNESTTPDLPIKTLKIKEVGKGKELKTPKAQNDPVSIVQAKLRNPGAKRRGVCQAVFDPSRKMPSGAGRFLWFVSFGQAKEMNIALCFDKLSMTKTHVITRSPNNWDDEVICPFLRLLRCYPAYYGVKHS
ncbi:hypothetical protein KO566_11845 [Flavobacteriaceae bacterium XHP0103]|nr:hypothetical protein [Marixanthotalea marina]